MLGKNNKQARGASAKRAQPSRKAIVVRFAYPLLFSLLLIGAAGAIYSGGDTLLSKPVSRVAVTGQFRYVDRQQIAEQVQPLLQQGFVRLDLQAIREELKTRSWVFDVTVSRVWPDEISINVVEQQPIARWANIGYLNHRGKLFTPQTMQDIGGLPLLSGPKERTEQVMANFQQLGAALQQQGLTLRALSLDEQGSWTAVLDNQTQIILGSAQVMEKMRRFVKTYQAVLSQQFDRIERIDMRYHNGLSVAWRQPRLISKREQS